MKRFLAVLMLVVMLCGCVGLAEEQKFDYTVLEKLEGYSYDKFEKTWSYYGAYAKKYSDARLVIGIQVMVIRILYWRYNSMQKPWTTRMRHIVWSKRCQYWRMTH